MKPTGSVLRQNDIAADSLNDRFRRRYYTDQAKRLQQQTGRRARGESEDEVVVDGAMNGCRDGDDWNSRMTGTAAKSSPSFIH